MVSVVVYSDQTQNQLEIRKDAINKMSQITELLTGKTCDESYFILNTYST